MFVETALVIGHADPEAEDERCSGADRREVEVERSHRILLLIVGDEPHGARQLSVFYGWVLRGVSRGEWL